jgi:lipopolysaccharide/colanic/teichoic acid biosynthesis glycosyltransferase
LAEKPGESSSPNPILIMHPNPRTSDYELATARHLLFVGFDQNIDGHIKQFPYKSVEYQCTMEENSFLAFRWLESRVADLPTYNLPFAVLCNLDWLIEDRYRLAQLLAAHPDLCTVPLVAFTQKGKPINKLNLANHGVDDCYTVPVDWGQLETRLVFLNQYKPRVLEKSKIVSPELYGLKLPFKKRLFDLVGASLGILLSAWLWAPVMLAIWLESRGPVIYKSKRVGFGYQVFEFLKFRSMHDGAEGQLDGLQHMNQYQAASCSEQPVFVKIPGDPRVTRVGRFIRKYSIDELPQLLNVLRGEMSLVGNRPLPLYEAEALTRDEWSARFLAPAGITGLWQVSKRGQKHISAEERILLDIAYAQRPYSVWEDLKIVIKTFFALVQKEEV